MRHFLLKAMLPLVMAIASSVSAFAENVVYGIVPSSSFGGKTTSFDIDAVNADEKLAITTDLDLTGVDGVKCAASVGDKYFAFVTYYDEETYDDVVAFATVNFTTGNVVYVNNYSYAYGNPGYSLCGMAYNAATGVLYGIENVLLDEGGYETVLYSIDQTNGTLTEVTRYSHKFCAIACDANGKIYLFENEVHGTKSCPNVYELDSMFGLSQTLSNEEVSCGFGSQCSVVFSAEGNKIYYVVGSVVMEIDLDAKTIVNKGSLAKVVAGLTATKSSADGEATEAPEKEEKNTRFLVCKTQFGDAMGYVPNDVDMKKTYYFYNYDGNVSRATNFGRTYSDANTAMDYEIMYYTKNRFDQNGNLAHTTEYQWGVYDLGDMAWKKTFNEVDYKYNEAGQLIQDSTSTYYTKYFYNEDGTIAKTEKYYSSSDKLGITVTYGDYLAPGKPLSYVSKGVWESDTFNATIEYDDNGNKVSEAHFVSGNVPKYKQVEEWTYEGTRLVEYLKTMYNSNNEPEPYLKTSYWLLNGDENQVMSADSTYYEGRWSLSGCPTLYTYSDFNGMDNMTRMEISAELDPVEINTANLSFSIPELAYSMACKFVIYRDGIAIDTCDVQDILDFDTYECHYQDKNVVNGTHEYFVQPVFGSGSDFDEESMVWNGYYISDIVTLDMNTELPAVSDLRLASGYKVVVGSGFTSTVDKYAVIGWTNPSYPEELGFISNGLYLDSYQMADSITSDPQVSELPSNVWKQSTDFFVVTRYKYGKAISDTITVTMTNVDAAIASGVDNLTIDGDVALTVNGRTITLSSAANVSVFSANGQLVARKDNTDALELDALPAGTYVISVESNGKIAAYKYSLK